MNSRKAALVALVLTAIAIITPVCFAETEALSEDDYYITIPGTQVPDKDVHQTIANGKSHSWTVNVINISDEYINVSFSCINDNKHLTTSKLDAMTLGPSGSDIKYMSEGTFTINVDELSDHYDDIRVDLIVTIRDVADPESFIDNHIVFHITVESIYDTSGYYNKLFGFIPNTLPSPFDQAWAAALITIIVDTLVAGLVCRLVIPFLARLMNKRTETEDTKKFEKQLFYMIVPLVILLSLDHCLSILGVDPDLQSASASVTSILAIILMVVILWDVYVFVITSFLTNFEKKNEDSSIDTSLIPLFKMIGRIIFWVGGVSAILGAFGVNLQGILVSAGVISLGITMGAQNVLSQFFSGLVILMTRPFRAGDFLKINNEVYVVRKVKLMYTEFNNWAGDEIITMPNNVVSSATIKNTTKDDEACKHYVFFSVAYGTDIQKASEIMIEAAKKCDLVLDDGIHESPSVRVTDFLSSGIELRLAVYSPTFDDTGPAGGKLRQLVYEAFNENGIEIPYDRVQIDILSDKTAKE